MAGETALQSAFDLLCTTSGSKNSKLSVESVNKWFKQSAVIGIETGVTDADVQVAFDKAAKDKNEVTFTELKDCIHLIAKEKKVEANAIMHKLTTSAPPKMGQLDPAAPLDTDPDIVKVITPEP